MPIEVITALIGLIGIVIGVIPTYFFMRQRSLIEVEKLKVEVEKIGAEADKTKAEAEKIRSDLKNNDVQGMRDEKKAPIFLNYSQLQASAPLIELIQDSKDLFIGGVALGFATKRHRMQLLKQIEKGANIRFLVLNPDSPDVIEIAGILDIAPSQIRDDIRATLQDIRRLQERASALKTGSVDVRLLNRELPFSFFISNPKGSNGYFTAGIRAYGQRSTTRPHVLLKSDDKWFEYFVETCEDLWKHTQSLPEPLNNLVSFSQKGGAIPYRITGKGETEVLLITARIDPSKWIFPVGTVETGETLQKTAARECAEECGYIVDIGPKMGIIESSWGGSMTFFIARVTGEIEKYETDRKRKWVKLPELMSNLPQDFWPLAKKILEKLS